MVSSTTAPSTGLPAQAAPTAPELRPTVVVQQLLSERAERVAAPPAGRRAHLVRARAVPASTKTLLARRVAVRLARAGVVLRFARAQLGDPYRYGAAGPGAWDCSGLTKRSFAAAGITLPRRASTQSARGAGVRRAWVGDLTLWGGVGRAYHVGIYLGGGRVLHSPRPGARVKVAQVWGRPQFRRLF